MTCKISKRTLIFPDLKNASLGPHIPFFSSPWPFALLEDSLLEATQLVFFTFWPLISSSQQSDPTSVPTTMPRLLSVCHKQPPSFHSQRSLSFPVSAIFSAALVTILSQNIPSTPAFPLHISYQCFYVSFWPLFRLHLRFTLEMCSPVQRVLSLASHPPSSSHLSRDFKCGDSQMWVASSDCSSELLTITHESFSLDISQTPIIMSSKWTTDSISFSLTPVPPDSSVLDFCIYPFA